MAIAEGMMFKKEAAAQMSDLVKKGTFGFCVFECNDLIATYEELTVKGVEFIKPPTKEFYALRHYLRMIQVFGFHLEKKNDQL